MMPIISRPSLFVVAMSAIVLIGCGGPDARTSPSVAADSTKVLASSPVPDLYHETGILMAVEDGGYPLFAVDMEFNDGEDTSLTTLVSFTLNVEATQIDAAALQGWIGKKVTVEYLRSLDNNLLGIEQNGVSKSGDGVDVEWKTSTVDGVLSGADAPTAGDLPSVVTVTTADGEVLKFKYFIPPEMVAVNGQQVTAHYWVDTSLEITALALAE